MNPQLARRRQRRTPRPGVTQPISIPAPTGGINTVDPGRAMPPGDCIWAYNLIAAQYGLRSRLGYMEWCTGLTGAADNLVRSVLPFTGSHKNGSTDKLFACTSSGIWDVTASSASPTLVQAFSVTSNEAGWGTSCVMSTPAGRFLLYCDEENGYFVYTESTGLWAQVSMGGGGAQVSGVDPATFAHVVVWNNRAWFVQKDTTLGWYLGTNSIYGAATSFDFGPRMRAGGPLAGLYNWSYDAGGGMSTLLVGVGTAGDVVMYQGTDPTSPTTFGLAGTWSVGAVPYGRRIATDYGGDMLVMSLLGIVPLSKLVVGQPVVGGDRSVYATGKISNLFNLLTSTNQTQKGWSLFIHPTDNALLVSVPQASGISLQLAMSFATRGWTQYRNLPLLSSGTFNGTLFFGTSDGRVCKNTGYVDNVLLSNSNSYSPVQYSLLTSYSNGGSPNWKRIQEIRPVLLSQSPSAIIQAQALYDFNLTEPAFPAGSGSNAQGTWDNATWDSSLWGGDYTSSVGLQGGTGVGRDAAISIMGVAVSLTTLVGIDVFMEEGGLL